MTETGTRRTKSNALKQSSKNDRGRARAQRALGLNIRTAREKLALSQEAFADLCEIHRSHMGKIERGESNVTLSTIVLIARKLETTVTQLFENVK
jgi:DNA-binding XRE family transcriptional regulator